MRYYRLSTVHIDVCSMSLVKHERKHYIQISLCYLYPGTDVMINS